MKISLTETISKTLSKLEETQHDFWNIPRETGILLNTFVKMTMATDVLEIGTSNGYSGLWILEALKRNNGHLTTIEYYEKRQKLAIENFNKCGFEGFFTPLQGNANVILEDLESDKQFDIVFIDANKSEYINYFKLIKPHLKQNALIIADNIISHLAKVKPFIDAIDNDKDFQYEILETEGGLLIAYKN